MCVRYKDSQLIQGLSINTDKKWHFKRKSQSWESSFHFTRAALTLASPSAYPFSVTQPHRAWLERHTRLFMLSEYGYELRIMKDIGIKRANKNFNTNISHLHTLISLLYQWNSGQLENFLEKWCKRCVVGWNTDRTRSVFLSYTVTEKYQNWA